MKLQSVSSLLHSGGAHMNGFPLIQPFAIAALAIVPTFALAQQLTVSFFNPDPRFPIEITADTSDIHKSDGTALFKGNVLVVQRDILRLHCSSARVSYEAALTGARRLGRPSPSLRARELPPPRRNLRHRCPWTKRFEDGRVVAHGGQVPPGGARSYRWLQVRSSAPSPPGRKLAVLLWRNRAASPAPRA